jgi:hypothetical protein
VAILAMSQSVLVFAATGLYYAIVLGAIFAVILVSV